MSSKIHILKNNSQNRRQGLWGVIRSSGLVTLWKNAPELPSLSCHEKILQKKWLSMNHLVDSHQAKSVGTLILHFQSPELWQINFCYTYATLSVVPAIQPKWTKTVSMMLVVTVYHLNQFMGIFTLAEWFPVFYILGR